MFEPIKVEEYEKVKNKEEIELVEYDKIIFPSRATYNSAGYDICSPYAVDLVLKPGKKYLIPTLLKANLYYSRINVTMENPANSYGEMVAPDIHRSVSFDSIFLGLYPRSSLGFKYGFELLNTVGIIDQDYYSNPENDGHIMVGCKVEKELIIKPGDKFCQGIVQPFCFFKYEDTPHKERTGGMGSTGA